MVGIRGNDNVAMIGSAIHSMELPTSKFAMSLNGVMDNFPLGTPKYYWRLIHSLSTPVCQQWLRDDFSLLPLCPSAIITR
jgi:hypothetical protein